MSKKGQISEPVESHFGFHIVRFIDRKKSEPVKFDEVKKSIIAGEKERLAKKRQEDLITQVRSSSTATIYRDKVEALVTPLGDMLPKAAAEPAKPR
jgi:parvulin-like peptidyl-prolyl isomerase